MVAVSCTMSEIAAPEDENPLDKAPDTIYATIGDQPGDVDTKTFTDSLLRVVWNKDDRISYFNDDVYRVEYAFAGEDGAAGGNFSKIKSDDLVAAVDLSGKIYSVYPHQTDTEIDHDGIISFSLPAEQSYKKNSFGRGANTMVSKTDDNQLKFKNVGGYLALDLCGDNETVSAIYLKGNNGESLAGRCSIDMSSGYPASSMVQSPVIDEIKLTLDEPVKLGTTESTCTRFYIVLPPMTFSKGFTIHVVTPDGGVYEKSTTKEITITRNTRSTMAALKVKTTVESISINSISSNAGGYGKTVKNYKGTIINNNATYDDATRTFRITIPTVTDFSELVLNYTLSTGAVLKVNGEVITSGETPIDASDTTNTKLIVSKGYAEKVYKLVAKNTGLPVVRITTDGFTLADLESYKNSIQSSDKIDHRIWLGDGTGTSVRIEMPNGDPGIKVGGVPTFEVPTEIKGRGNYTWTWAKKPYALRLAKSSKGEVLGMSDHRRWILLANWRDRTLLRNDAAFWLSDTAGMAYTPKGKFVELEFNGVHRGNYYLCEQIKIDKNRVSITEMKSKNGVLNSKTGGFLMEIDSYWDEAHKFKSSGFNLKYMFKEPDEDTTANPEFKEAYKWMEDYINEFEQVLKTKSSYADSLYKNYLDVDSAIMFMLLNEVAGNRDYFQNGDDSVFGPHSTYLYKDVGENSKIYFGPIWDFDYETFMPGKWYNSQWGNGSFSWRGFTNKGYYYYYLCYDPWFVQRVKTIWNNNKNAFLKVTDYIDEMAALISLSQQFDELIWPYHNENYRNDNHDYYENNKVVPYKEAISRMKTSFEARVEWMDGEINNFTPTNPFK